MALTETIKIVVETTTGAATKGFNDLRSSVKEADGLFGKLRAGTASVGQTLSTLPLPLVAGGLAAAGTAALAFGKQAVSAFQDTALAADKLANATGLTTEESSKWIAVADDIGIGSDKLLASFGKFGKELGANRSEWAKLGITATDTNGALLQAIDLIRGTEDPLKRAELGARLFGRSWTEISELIVTGSGEIKAAMGEVSEAQIIDKEEVRKAKEMRAASDQLGDSLGDISRTIGEALIPAAAAATKALAELFENPVVKGAIDVLASSVEVLSTSLNTLTDFDGEQWADQFTGSVEDLAATLNVLSDGGKAAVASIEDYERRIKAANENVDLGPWEEQKAATLGVRDGMNYAAKAAAEYEAAQDKTNDTVSDSADVMAELAEAANDVLDAFLSLPEAQDNVTEAQEDMVAAIAAFNQEPTEQNLRAVAQGAEKLAQREVELAKAQAQANGATLNATQQLDVMNRALLGQAATLNGPARQAILNRIAALNGIPPQKLTQIAALIDQGRLAEAERQINQTSRSRTAAITADANTAQAERDLNYAARPRDVAFRARATGELVRSAQGGVARFANGGVALVGERGPELVGLPEGAQVMPAERLEQIAKRQIDQTIRHQVNMTLGALPRRYDRRGQDEVMRHVRNYIRRNGQVISGRL